jgi:hypothetical protein
MCGEEYKLRSDLLGTFSFIGPIITPPFLQILSEEFSSELINSLFYSQNQRIRLAPLWKNTQNRSFVYFSPWVCRKEKQEVDYPELADGC